MSAMVANSPLFPILLLTSLVTIPGVQEQDRSPVFSQLSFEQARERAEESECLLIVVATAEWCPPCKLMDETTWTDSGLVGWLEQEAIVIRIDVDDQRSLASRLDIKSVPTVIVYRQGKLFDRVVGYQSTEEAAAWLKGVKRGETYLERLRSTVYSRDTSDIRERFRLASLLIQQGSYKEALPHCLLIMKISLEQGKASGRVLKPGARQDLLHLIDEHLGARKELERERDVAWMELKEGELRQESLARWVILNELLRGRQRTIDWLKEVHDASGGVSLSPDTERILYDLLIESLEYELAGSILEDPLAFARWQVARAGPEPLTQDPKRVGVTDATAESADSLRARLSRLYAVTLLAGRDTEANSVAQYVLAADNSAAAYASFVESALAVGEPRVEHRAFLAEAARDLADVTDLRERLEEQLSRRASNDVSNAMRGAPSKRQLPFFDPHDARSIVEGMMTVYANCSSCNLDGTKETIFIQGTSTRICERPFQAYFVRPSLFLFQWRSRFTTSSRWRHNAVWHVDDVPYSWMGEVLRVEESLGIAIAAAAGESGGSVSRVAALLMPDLAGDWTAIRTGSGEFELLGNEPVVGVDCFKIRWRGKMNSILWIGVSDLLLYKEYDEYEYPSSPDGQFRTRETTLYRQELDVKIPRDVFEFEPPQPR